MPQFRKMQFLIPEKVKKRIDSGQYELVGGIIRNAVDGRPVLWLIHKPDLIGRAVKGIGVSSATAKLVCLVPMDLGFTLAFAGFGFLLGVFSEKKKRIEEISAKIDRTQLAQLEAGLQLAIDADEIREPEEATQQIVNARQSIQQGLTYFAQELVTQQKNNISAIDLVDLIGLLAVGHLALVRTYLCTGDYSLARNRLLRLGLIIVESRILLFKQLRRLIAAKAGWRKYFSFSVLLWIAAAAVTGVVTFVSWPLVVVVFGAYMIYREMSSEDKVETESRDFEERLRNKRAQASKIEQKIKDVASKYNVDYSKIVPAELAAIKSTEHFIDGYLAEVAYFKKHQIRPIGDFSESLPIAASS